MPNSLRQRNYQFRRLYRQKVL